MSVQAEGSVTQLPEQPNGNVPPAVLEICGAENIALVENLSAEMLAWRELVQSSDPFANVTRADHESDATILPDTPFQDSLDKVHVAETLSYGGDPSRQELGDIGREHAPILAEVVSGGSQQLVTRAFELEDRLRQVGCEISERTAPGTTDVSVADIRTLHDSMVELAAQFPAPAEIKLLGQAVHGEITARVVDGRTVGAQERPDIAAVFVQLTEEKTSDTPESNETPQAVYDEKLKELSEVLWEIGFDDPGLQEAHRGMGAIIADEDLISGNPTRLKSLQAEGTEMHGALVKGAKEAVARPVERLSAVLAQLKEGNTALLARGKGELSPELLEELQAQCLEAERYIVGHAKVIVASLHAVGRKPSPDARRQLHDLRQEPLRRTYELQQRRKVQHVGTTSVAKEVAPDRQFRQDCSTAKKIVDGGDHLDHPNASPLAKALHTVTLGEKQDIRFARQQKGIVVALLTTGLSPLQAARERILSSNGSGSDAQVELLRRELPRQFDLLRDFDLEGSLIGLKNIFDNPYCRNQLLNPLTRSGFDQASQRIETIRATLTELVAQQQAAAA